MTKKSKKAIATQSRRTDPPLAEKGAATFLVTVSSSGMTLGILLLFFAT